jgi:hypothetical protein
MTNRRTPTQLTQSQIASLYWILPGERFMKSVDVADFFPSRALMERVDSMAQIMHEFYLADEESHGWQRSSRVTALMPKFKDACVNLTEAVLKEWPDLKAEELLAKKPLEELQKLDAYDHFYSKLLDGARQVVQPATHMRRGEPRRDF